jgi:hypothetical protein
MTTEVAKVTDPHKADDEKAPPQTQPGKPEPQRTPEEGSPPSDQPSGQPQHEPTNPDDD